MTVMNKELFKKMIQEMVSEAGYIPEEVEYVKNNVTYAGLIGKKSETKNGAYSVINIDSLYEDYINRGLRFEDIMNTVLDILNYSTKEQSVNEISKNVMDWNFVKDKLFIAVCDFNKNQKLLDNVVYQRFADDLAVYVRIGVNIDGTAATTPVLKTMLEEYSLSEDEFFRYAFESSHKLCPPTLKNMLNLIKESFIPDVSVNIKYIVKYDNDAFDYGAAVIFYDGVLDTVREVVGGDFYLLPSSIHEMIIVPVVTGKKDEAERYKSVVCDVNGSTDIISPADVLTNSVYMYDGTELKKFA